MLTFQINKVKGVLFTRRGLLSKIAGMFDPLGLASPATISLGLTVPVFGTGCEQQHRVINPW